MRTPFDWNKVPTQYSPGSFLHWPGKNGLHLYGLACFEHGLQYVVEGRPLQVAQSRAAIPIRGAKPPSDGDAATCWCGRPLAGPLEGHSELDVRDQALMDLFHIAKGWRGNWEATCP